MCRSLCYRFSLVLIVLASLLGCTVAAQAADGSSAQNTPTGDSQTSLRSLQGGEVKPLFDGKSLDGWRGRADLWSVQDGAIVGRTSDDKPLTSNTFLILNEEIDGDFELTLQFKIQSGNSGIQYHSKVVNEDEFVVAGYQADMDAGNQYAGILYEEKGRGILALRGQSVVIGKDGEKQSETFADTADLAKGIHPGQWNDYRIVVRGTQLEHYINEALTVTVTDNQSDKASDSGVIALQLHAGPPMTVLFKNITLRQWQ